MYEGETTTTRYPRRLSSKRLNQRAGLRARRKPDGGAQLTSMITGKIMYEGDMTTLGRMNLLISSIPVMTTIIPNMTSSFPVKTTDILAMNIPVITMRIVVILVTAANATPVMTTTVGTPVTDTLRTDTTRRTGIIRGPGRPTAGPLSGGRAV